jgi:hypothetical protein
MQQSAVSTRSARKVQVEVKVKNQSITAEAKHAY